MDAKIIFIGLLVTLTVGIFSCSDSDAGNSEQDTDNVRIDDADVSTGGETNEESGTDTDANADTDTGGDADSDDTDSDDTDASTCDYECRSESWCDVSDGILHDDLTCPESQQRCCEVVDADTDDTDQDTGGDTDSATCTYECHSANWCNSNLATVFSDLTCDANQICCVVE